MVNRKKAHPNKSQPAELPRTGADVSPFRGPPHSARPLLGGPVKLKQVADDIIAECQRQISHAEAINFESWGHFQNGIIAGMEKLLYRFGPEAEIGPASND